MAKLTKRAQYSGNSKSSHQITGASIPKIILKMFHAVFGSHNHFKSRGHIWRKRKKARIRQGARKRVQHTMKEIDARNDGKSLLLQEERHASTRMLRHNYRNNTKVVANECQSVTMCWRKESDLSKISPKGKVPVREKVEVRSQKTSVHPCRSKK